MSEITFSHGEEFNFAKPQFRALLRDSRLSWGARGLFQFCWDLPANWQVSIAHLANMGKEKQTSIRRFLREIEECGGLKRVPVKLESLDEVEKLTEKTGRNYRIGQNNGSKIILLSPHLWAQELSFPRNFVFHE